MIKRVEEGPRLESYTNEISEENGSQSSGILYVEDDLNDNSATANKDPSKFEYL